jgi:hypothetical protein
MSFNGDLYSTDEGLELTTKGQIHTHNSSGNVALNVSSNDDYVLVEDSSTATGLAWKVNAHSSVTPSSTTTFTNKSISFGTNTITSTLAQLDTALGTTGTASATTFLRGDNSWASAGGGQVDLIGTQTLGSDGTNVTITSMGAASSTYAYWIVKGAFQTVSGGENVQFRINGSTSANYQTNMILNVGGTLSATTENAQTSALICTDACATAGESFQLLQTILLEEQNATNTMRFNWYTQPIWDQGGLAPDQTQASVGLFNNNFQNTLDTVDFFLAGGSDWKAGSGIQVFGVKRA